MFDDDGMDEIKQIFLEESSEGLDIMESGLLKLEAGVGDLDLINDVFRAAHSLKGGGGTFGFTEISEFTHGVETILDEMRDEVREATENTISVLLECVDCLRGMLDTIRDGGEYDTPRIQELGTKIQGLLDNPDAALLATNPSVEPTTEIPPAADEHIAEESSAEAIDTHGMWHIRFTPDPGMLATGNEPYRIFREMEKLGELEITADCSKLADIKNIKADQSYLSWSLLLDSDCKKQNIEELFEWVAEQATIVIDKNTPTEDV
ncbi:MAG: Hpt domain-containing protein, partial [Sinobacterium sp.]|nr:Hpt domain-containing protein [Sinobacterium sp.]